MYVYLVSFAINYTGEVYRNFVVFSDKTWDKIQEHYEKLLGEYIDANECPSDSHVTVEVPKIQVVK